MNIMREYLLKIGVIGSHNKFKKDFVRSFAEGTFPENYLPTLGVDITTKKIDVDGNPIKLILVDALGREFFGKLSPSYYRGVSALMIIFDKADRQSFKDVPDWQNEFKKYISDDIPVTLVGFVTNSEEVSTEEGQAMATQLDLTYFECLPTNSKQVAEIFQFLVRKIVSTNKQE